ncbi:MAG: hypothetical protein IPK16_08965 [Anaerolineales bacterium]|nr:hypothetical protein [Anaerolineales bacterium]
MGKVFYTERDIEDMHARGVTQLDVNDDVVITDVAREKAMKLGIRLQRAQPGARLPQPNDEALVQQVKAAVVARLGDQRVDPALLDAVIRRVMAALPPG